MKADLQRLLRPQGVSRGLHPQLPGKGGPVEYLRPGFREAENYYAHIKLSFLTFVYSDRKRCNAA